MTTPTAKSPRTRHAAAPRKPGRPRGDTSDQRERLLDAALDHYARTGIAATSLRAVAASAGVTPAMISYYFGGKEQLLGAVVEQRLLPMMGTLRERMDAAGDDAGALVAAFVSGIHEAIARHPWLPSLWLREILGEGGALRERLLPRIAPQVPRVLAERLAAGQRRGALNPDIDPRLLVVSLIGLTLFPFAAAPIWRRLFDAGDIDQPALLRHTLALLDRGLEVNHAR